MDEIITRAECYVKGEESNMEKRARDSKDKGSGRDERARPRDAPTTRERARDRRWPSRPRAAFGSKETFTPLNTRREDILRDINHLKLLTPPYSSRWTVNTVLGSDPGAWCEFHRLKGHTTESCIQLRREIVKLIQRGKLSTYVKEDPGRTSKRDSSPRRDSASDSRSKKKGKAVEEVKEARSTRHTLNTISGGFAGGGSTSSARKGMLEAPGKYFASEPRSLIPG